MVKADSQIYGIDMKHKAITLLFCSFIQPMAGMLLIQSQINQIAIAKKEREAISEVCSTAALS